MQIIAASIFVALALLALHRLTRPARVRDCTLLMPHDLRDLLGGDDE